MKPTLMTTAHVACWTIRERSSSRMGRWSLERSTALKPAAASPCRATAWRFAAWLRLKKAWSSEEKIFWKPPKSIKKKKTIQIPKITQFKNQMIPNGLFEKKKIRRSSCGFNMKLRSFKNDMVPASLELHLPRTALESPTLATTKWSRCR